MSNIAIAATIAVLCLDVRKSTCREASIAVDAWNEAAGRQLFEISDTHPAHGRKVLLQEYRVPLAECGMHTAIHSGPVSVIYINMMNIERCRLLPTLLHELGHKLGLQHDTNPFSMSIMRERPAWNQNRPARIDIERLNAIEARRGRAGE